MKDESKIALDCPECGALIYETAAWFCKSFSTCPECEKPLRREQFDVVIHDLEQAFDARIEEMMSEVTPGGCCGSQKKGCCGS